MLNLRDLKKLSLPIQLILSTAILMPFIYTSLYFFNEDFYRQADQIILLIITYVISFLLLSSLFIIFDITDPNPELKEKKEFKERFHQILSQTIIILLIWIVVFDFINYSIWRIYGTRLEYYYHVICYFVPFIYSYIEHLCLSIIKGKDYMYKKDENN